MDDSKALGILRTIAPEFKAVSDDEAQQFLVLSAPLVSRKKFGELYDQAVALLAAHRMKLAGYGISVVGGSASSGGATPPALRLPVWVRGVQMPRSIRRTSTRASDSWYALTPMAWSSWNLRRLRVMPITSGGER